MKIAILNPKEDFSPEEQAQLSTVGDIAYMKPPAITEHPLQEIIELCKDADIIALDPDVLGGFEKARERVIQLMDTIPTLKAIALGTTSFGWIDLDYCKKKNVIVSNCPGWSRESVAEQAFALLFCLARNIILLDRREQKGKYQLEQGFELRGKTLGIIGVGSIGSTLAKLANGIGMRVIGYNHSSKQVENVEMKNTLEELLVESDAISIHVTNKDENKNMLGKKELEKVKNGVIVVNVASRNNVDEDAMAEVIKSGKVFGYAFEGEDLQNTPLIKLENVIALKPFAWYTKEAIQNLFQVWTDNMVALAKNKSQNIVG